MQIKIKERVATLRRSSTKERNHILDKLKRYEQLELSIYEEEQNKQMEHSKEIAKVPEVNTKSNPFLILTLFEGASSPIPQSTKLRISQSNRWEFGWKRTIITSPWNCRNVVRGSFMQKQI